MAVFVSDSFTDTDSTNLTAHTGTVGATWTLHASYATAWVIGGNRAVPPQSTASLYYASGVPSDADYDVEAIVRPTDPVESAVGVCGRIDTAANTLYIFQYATSLLRWDLGRFVTGGYTTMASSAATLTPDTDYAVKLEMRGTTIKGYVDGVEVVSATSNHIVAAGKAGVRGSRTGAAITRGIHIDNFTATDTSVSGQTAAPISTISAGGWTAVNAATIHEAIDEGTASDADYAESSLLTTTPDPVRVKFGTLTDPNVHTDHTVSYRLVKDTAGGYGAQVTARLYQGATLISTDPTVRTVPDAATTYSWTVAEADAANISDYSDLRLDISAVRT